MYVVNVLDIPFSLSLTLIHSSGRLHCPGNPYQQGWHSFGLRVGHSLPHKLNDRMLSSIKHPIFHPTHNNVSVAFGRGKGNVTKGAVVYLTKRIGSEGASRIRSFFPSSRSWRWFFLFRFLFLMFLLLLFSYLFF